MTRYLCFVVSLLAVAEVARSRSWHGYHNHDFGHDPWHHGHRHRPHNHGWGMETGDSSSNSRSNEWVDRNDNGWGNVRRPIHYDINACVASCPISTICDPVCGTDNVTYRNMDQLFCARQCGVAVEPLKMTQCESKSNGEITETFTSSSIFDNSNGSERPGVDTTPPSARPVVRQTSFDLNGCMSACATSTVYSPVCGSDGFTYNNEEQIYCAQLCGIEVTISGLAACPSGNNNGNGNDWTNRPSLPNTVTPLTPSDNECLRACPITPEYNPICGTNGVTYNNDGHLFCAQMCGIEVTLWRRSPCPAIPKDNGNVVTTQPPPDSDTTISPEIRECIRTCPVTTEYNPVCGTNNVTYSNQGRLDCARDCGIAVNILRFTACSVVPSTVTTPPPQTIPSPNPLIRVPDKTDMQQTTIPSDVLASVFTDAPTTEETTEVSVDPRINIDGRTFNRK